MRAFAVTQLAGASGIIFGGYGGRVVFDRFLVGGGGFGLTDQVGVAPRSTSDSSARRRFLGSGGVFGEFMPFPHSVVKPTVGVFVGLANIAYEIGGALPYATTKGFVIAPQVTIEARASHTLELGIGASYRYVRASPPADALARDVTGLAGLGFVRLRL